MVKAKKKIMVLLCTFLLILGIGCTAGATDIDEKIGTSLSLEQAKLDLPDIWVYYYPAEDTPSTPDQISASLGGEKLTVESVRPAASEEKGTNYYLMLDISGSISKGYFANIKKSVLTLQQSMTEKDTLTLITFGDKVTVICENIKKTDDIQEQVEALQNGDMTTLLLEAVKKTAELADQRENADNRTVFIMVTDGEDFSKEATKQEVLTTLQKKSIPLYAMTVKETNKGAQNQYISEFGEFARQTGGQAKSFGEAEAEATMTELVGTIQSASVLKLKSSSNRVGETKQTLQVIFGGEDAVRTMDVYPTYYQKDEMAPTATVERYSDHELKITYSEPVLHAEEESNYTVKFEGEQVLVRQASYTGGTKPYSILLLEEDVDYGTYEVTFQNICDDSVEGNLLTAGCSVKVEEDAVEILDEDETDKDDKKKDDKKKDDEEEGIDRRILIGAGIAIVVICLILLILLLTRKKKNQEKEPEEEETSDDGYGEYEENGYGQGAGGYGFDEAQSNDYYGGDLGITRPGEQQVVREVPGIGRENNQKHYIPMEQGKPADYIFLEMNTAKGVNRIRVQIVDQIVVGRSDKCNVFLDDTRMSRQHFVIEKEGNSYYVRDLQTTNGTMLNGVRLVSRRKLQPGDDIQAGSVQMKIRW